LHSAPIAATGWIVPISLLACISDTSAVSGRIAARSASRSTRPRPSTPSTVTSQPSCSRYFIGSSTALCSVAQVIRCLPLSRYMRAAPRIARLFDSVAPEVNTISRPLAPMPAPMDSRA
jgi:hypothetical protein